MQLATVVCPLAFVILGALVYALTNGKLPELGRLTFFAGVLMLCYALMHQSLHI